MTCKWLPNAAVWVIELWYAILWHSVQSSNFFKQKRTPNFPLLTTFRFSCDHFSQKRLRKCLNLTSANFKFNTALWISGLIKIDFFFQRPLASHVLTSHIRQRQYPNWTSFSVKYKSVSNDQFGLTTFNWDVDGHNYNILRTGSFPFVKYYCTKRPKEDLKLENTLYTALKIANLGELQSYDIFYDPPNEVGGSLCFYLVRPASVRPGVKKRWSKNTF